MSNSRTKIEHWNKDKHGNTAKAGVHKEMKKQRNRKIRRTPLDKEPETKKYDTYEY